MEKVIIRGCILLSVFLGSWFLLQQVNWIGFFNINPLLRNEYVNKIEVKLGELMYDDFTSRYSVVNDDLAVATIDTIVTKICKANNINRKELKVYLLESEEVNAFALPNHQLMIYTGLAKNFYPRSACWGNRTRTSSHPKRSRNAITRERNRIRYSIYHHFGR